LRRLVPIVVVLLFAAGEAVATCDPVWLRQLVSSLNRADEATRVQAQAWIKRFHQADELTSRGMLGAVQSANLKALLATFHKLEPKDFPFAGANVDDKADEMYRAIGRLTGENYEAVTGLKGRLGSLTSDNSPSNQKGALLEIKIGSDLLAEVGDPALVRIQAEGILIPANGQVRKYDARLSDPAAPAPLGGRMHEAKNWPDGLQGQGPSNAFLRDYADREFPGDILLHGSSNFVWYRVDMRDVLNVNTSNGVRDADVVLDELLKKFDDPLIVQELGGLAAKDVAKEVFRQRWIDGTIVRYH
jgi:hypothetical protein